ncbi:far upstream element-binding protein 3 isoform X3 [Trichoplusia ni]|nr:far upstream element-binding protein 3 isoform X3 [Trichoplusia ni]
MSAPSAVAVVSRAAAPPASAAPPPPPNAGAGSLMPDQTLNEYIRVPDKMVGLIIGRGGEQITRLQAESGCKIQMAPDSGGQPDRLCTLTGSREAILRAKELVNQIVNHRGRENAPQHGEGAGAGGGPGMPPPPPRGAQGSMAQEEIMLPGPKVGLIIGKNGKTIKQLQEQSGAKMVVIQDGPNTEYEKPLRISGDPAKVEHAKQLVYELLADKDMQQGGGPRPPPYDDNYAGHDQGNGLATNSTEVLVPKVAVGIVIGRGGDMIKKIQAETGCRVQFHQERDDGPNDKRCYLQGKPHQVDQARQMIEDLISSVNRREQEVRAGRGRGGAAARNGERGAGDYAAWQDAQEIRVTFTVSNVKCGLIIGRGGEVIKQINAESGAHCELDRRAQGSDRNNRTFYIRGHPEAVDHCKRIIMEKVGMPVNFIQEGSNGGNGGNGNGNGNGGNGGEYYGGGGGGGPPAWGYNPHWHQPAQQQAPQQQVQINPATGQPDYSQQWIDYYRSLGLMREAEAIEQQAKQQQQQQQQQPQPGGGGGNGGGTPPASGATPAPPAGGSQPDYSAQWAEYYRSIGKLKEAEAIEQQIKMKSSGAIGGGGGGGSSTPGGGAAGAGAAGGAGAGGQYAQYGVYAPAVYPAYQPYPAYPQPNAEHHQ